MAGHFCGDFMKATFCLLAPQRAFRPLSAISPMRRAARLAALGACLVALAACGAMKMPGGGGSASPSTGASGSGTAATPAPARTPPGMNERGEVVDSKAVTAGTGQKVKGLEDWEGEIHGRPAAGSRFSRLQIGMSMKQVTDIAGQPTDAGAYITGRAFIPFYFGSDRHRYEMVYKGQGRLIFAGGTLGNYTGGNLIWIIHNPNESGIR